MSKICIVHWSPSRFPMLPDSWLADKFPSQRVRSLAQFRITLPPSLPRTLTLPLSPGQDGLFRIASSLHSKAPSSVKSSPAPPDRVRPKFPSGSHPILVHSPLTATVPYFVTAQTSASPGDCRLPQGAILCSLCPRWLVQRLVHSRHLRDTW